MNADENKPPSSESEGSTKRGRGRPKGSKNKPKKGRPRKHPKPHKKRTVLFDKDDGSELMLPLIRDPYKTRSQLAITPSIDAAVVPKESLSSQTQDQLLDAELNIDKFTEQGFNSSDNEEIKEINEDPVDASFYYRGAKNIPVAGAQYSFTADMVLELQRCRADVVYFAENFFFIVTIDKGKQKIKLYEAQRRILRSLADNRFVSLLSARQTGKSTLLTIFVLWMVCFNKDYRAAIVANKETTAINIFKRIRLAYEQLPNYIKPGVKDYAKTGMTLENDSSVIVSTTTATSIRGDTLNCLAGNSLVFFKDKEGMIYELPIENIETEYGV